MTTIYRQERTRLKEEAAVKNARDFEHHVMVSIFANMASTGDTPAFPMTIRRVRDTWGRDAAAVFKLMFRQLVRGGLNKQGKPFKSHWVVNQAAMKPLLEWVSLNTNLKVLHRMLLDAGAFEEVWARSCNTFVLRSMLKRKQRER